MELDHPTPINPRQLTLYQTNLKVVRQASSYHICKCNCWHNTLARKTIFNWHTSPGCMIVLNFFTKGERASSLNCKHKSRQVYILNIHIKTSGWRKNIDKDDLACKDDITCDICSAAATLGLTTSTFAITSVFGTLPSVWKLR